MKKSFLLIVLLSLLFAPVTIYAAGLVPCGNPGEPACTIGHFFEMLARIYNFIVWNIAAPLAIIGITVGAIFMLISAGNPDLFNRGKEIIKWAVIGLFLVFASWVIINTILTALGYKGAWNAL